MRSDGHQVFLQNRGMMDDEFSVICGSIAALILLSVSIVTLTCCCHKKKDSKNQWTEDQEKGTIQEYGYLDPEQSFASPRLIIDGKNSRITIKDKRTGEHRRLSDGEFLHPLSMERHSRKKPDRKTAQEFNESVMGNSTKSQLSFKDRNQNGHCQVQEGSLPVQHRIPIVHLNRNGSQVHHEPFLTSSRDTATHAERIFRHEPNYNGDTTTSIDRISSRIPHSQAGGMHVEKVTKVSHKGGVGQEMVSTVSTIERRESDMTRINRTLPDVVHSTSTEDDYFGAIERNSELLSSFQRPPPPLNRSKRGRRPPRRQLSSRTSQSEELAVSPLNEWNSMFDDFSLGPAMISPTSQTKMVHSSYEYRAGSRPGSSSFKKVTREVMPDGSIVETTESSSGDVDDIQRKCFSNKLDTPTIDEVEEPTESYDDITCETLRRNRRMSQNKYKYAFDDVELNTLQRRKKGEKLVKQFPVGNVPIPITTDDQFFKSLRRQMVRRHDRPGGHLELDQYGNLIMRGHSIKA